jgi:hypothetical protein
MPRFSNGNTWATPGSRDISVVRSARTSMTVRTRDGGNAPKDELWSLVKQTTSHRPTPGRTGTRSVIWVTSSGWMRSLNDGNWFSKTTTS